jgi:glycosyltransferase involved in cell wall biosynthesis
VLTKQNYDFVVSHKINRPEKVFEIQNGICLDKLVTPHEDEKRKLQEKLLIPLDAKVVLAPTRFAPEKNTDLILKIAPRVLKEVKNCIFLVVGDGPLLNQFRTRVQERHLVNYIHTPGFYPDVQELLGITDVFLLPSKLELHSIAILEAMSRRVPVVVSKNVGCNDEFIDDWENGVLRDPFKDDGWAEALVKLFHDETLRRKIGENGYSTCKKKFDIRDIAKKIESLYTELVQK